jgi:hypothetical protein
MVKVTVERTGRGPLFTQWSMYGLVDGYVARMVRASTLAFTVRNYLQNDGVRGSTNSVEARVDAASGVRFSRLEVRRSCILETRASPHPVSVNVTRATYSLGVGEATDIEYSVVTKGPQRVGASHLVLNYDSSNLRVEIVGRSSWPAIDGVVSGSLRVRVLKEGPSRLGIGVVSDYNSPGVTVVVSGLEQASHVGGVLFAAGVGAVACGIALAARRRPWGGGSG